MTLLQKCDDNTIMFGLLIAALWIKREKSGTELRILGTNYKKHKLH